MAWLNKEKVVLLKKIIKLVGTHILVCIGASQIHIDFNVKQAKSENFDPPPGNKFDLEVGQMSRWRSWYGAHWKGMSQGSCMPNINALSSILQKIWARLKFFLTDRQMDGRMSLMSPAFVKGGGQICDFAVLCDAHEHLSCPWLHIPGGVFYFPIFTIERCLINGDINKGSLFCFVNFWWLRGGHKVSEK